mgnify:CR=1 FL=1
MAYEITFVCRLERLPDLDELRRVFEDAFDDAVVLEIEWEEV